MAASEARPRDVLIAVMGITGSGKSTFISHCTDTKVDIGTGLRSSTNEIQGYIYSSKSNSTVRLIDTPGFDDTNRSDEEVLRDIAAWVTGIYQKKILLRGILYLHRITDDRMQGSAKNNLFLFRKLCGKNAMKNTVLVTTMWENLAKPEDGGRRETELRETPEFWGEMIEEGSRIERHYNNKESAARILEKLLSSTTETKLAIQEEMVDQGKDLHETGAGFGLNSILGKKLEKIYQYVKRLEDDQKEAKEENDRETMAQIRQLQQQKDAEIDKLRQQQENMKISLEKLHEQQYNNMKANLEEIYNDKLKISDRKLEEQQRRIDDLIAQSSKPSWNSKEDVQINNSSPIWDPGLAQCVHVITAHPSWSTIQQCQVSPNSEFLASTSRSAPKLWNLATGQCLHTLENKTDNKPVLSVDFSPDSQILALGKWGTIEFWSTSTGKCIHTLPDHTATAWHVAFSPDSQLFASASVRESNHSSYWTISLWNPSTWQRLHLITGRHINCIGFSPDSTLLAAGSRDSTIKLWNSTTGKCVHTLTAPLTEVSVNSITFSPNSQLLVGCGTSLWNTTTGQCVFRLVENECVISVAYSPDSRIIALAYRESTSLKCLVKLLDPTTGQCLHTLTDFENVAVSMAFSPNSQLLVSSAWNSTIKVWNPTTAECLRVLPGHPGGSYVTFSPNSKFLVSASLSHEDTTIRVWA